MAHFYVLMFEMLLDLEFDLSHHVGGTPPVGLVNGNYYTFRIVIDGGRKMLLEKTGECLIFHTASFQ
jgi:hypothetical protein